MSSESEGGASAARGGGGSRWSAAGGWLLIVVAAALVQAALEVGYFEGRRALGRSHLERPERYFRTAPALQAGLFVGLTAPALALGLARRAWMDRIMGFAVVGLTAFACLLWFYRLHPAAVWFLAIAVGYRGGTVLARRRRGAVRAAAAAIPALALGFGVAGALEGRGGDAGAGTGDAEAVRRALADHPRRAGDGPNVLFIVLDTLRADMTGLVPDGDPEATPFLRELAARGVNFTRAIAPSSWTLPSHASMFTGLPAEQLGVGPKHKLEDRFATLAEVLRDRGYATLGVSANWWFCTERVGLGQGFALFEDRGPGESALKATRLGDHLKDEFLVPLSARALIGLGARFETVHRLLFPDKLDAARVNDRLAAALDGRGGASGPVLLFANYVDVHNPYFTPESDRPGPRGGGTYRDFEAINHPLTSGNRMEGREGLMADAYKHCLRYLDERLRELFEELEARGFLEDCVVVVTSDHGESLGEHGIHQHGRSLHQTEIRVPLLIVAPGRVPAGARVDAAVSLTDVGATILDAAGIEAEFPGRSLRAAWEAGGKSDGNGRAPYASLGEFRPMPNVREGKRMALPARALVREGRSLIREANREHYYDLETDPGETRNLAEGEGADPEVRRGLEEARRTLEAIREENERARKRFGIE